MRIITSIALAAAAVDAAKVKGPPTINQSNVLHDDPPLELIVCEDDQSTLVITVFTDNYPHETTWKHKKRNGFRDWQTVAERSYFPSSLTEYSDTFCLDSGVSYRWTIEDDLADGLYFAGVCESYTVNLDGFDIGSGAKFNEYANVIATGDDCVDGMDDFLFSPSEQTSRLAKFSCKPYQKPTMVQQNQASGTLTIR